VIIATPRAAQPRTTIAAGSLAGAAEQPPQIERSAVGHALEHAQAPDVPAGLLVRIGVGVRLEDLDRRRGRAELDRLADELVRRAGTASPAGRIAGRSSVSKTERRRPSA